MKVEKWYANTAFLQVQVKGGENKYYHHHIYSGIEIDKFEFDGNNYS